MEKIGELEQLQNELHLVRKELEKKSKILEFYEKQALYDSLTGLKNANSYANYMGHLDAASLHSMGLILSDINGLKGFNEKYGREYGDEIVCNIAKIIARNFEGHHIFRDDGDEMIVFCENISNEEFISKIQKMRIELLSAEGEGISIGIRHVEGKINLDELLTDAHKMLHEEKAKFYQDKKIRGTRANLAELRQLMDDINNKRYEVFLQPKIESQTGDVCGAEALARFKSDENLYVLPNNFIPTLENENLIRYLDIFVFEEVCRLIKLWTIKGYRILPLSFNFSRITLLEPNIVNMVKNIQQNYKISKDLIEIEITETTGNWELEEIADVVNRFKAEGFRVALDDFGAKNTNLAMLTALNLDRVKLDKCLIDGLGENEKHRTVVKHAIALCKDMGISVIAEGVEERQQLEFLKQQQCEQIQGFIFDRPMPIPEFEKKYHVQAIAN